MAKTTNIALRPLETAELAVASITPEDVYNAWLDGRRATTRLAYDGDVRDFARFLGLDSAIKAIDALVSSGHGNANRLALAYRASLLSRGLKSATIARRLAALRSFVKLAKQLGQVAWDLDVEAPKVEPYRDTRGPGDEGWREIRRRASVRAMSGDPVRVRDRALLRVMHDLALRVAETVGLDMADVEMDGGGPSSVWILGKGKTEKQRIELANPTGQALYSWIVVRGREPGPLFVRLDRALREYTRITAGSVRRMVRRAGIGASCPRRLRPHGLRHHAITFALDRTGGNIATVQRFSRHADPRTLMIYNDRRNDGEAEVGKLVAEEDE